MQSQILALLQKYLPGPIKPSGGSNVLTKCPFHKGGEERKPSFSVNCEQGIFHCFTCHESGNIRHLLKMLQVPAATIDAETKIIQPVLERNRELFKLQKSNVFSNRDPYHADYVLPESLLGIYARCPIKLRDDGFSTELLEKLEIGYDKNLNRIMYPLRDMYGNLAGFSGGVTEWSTEQHPKYKVYQGRRKDLKGKWIPGDFGQWFDNEYSDYRCENHDFLWNFDRVYPNLVAVSDPSATLYVVEGFKACLWMLQAGFKNTVALMGSYISDRQQQQIQRLGCTVQLFLDNDEAGRRATFNVGNLLWIPLYGKVRVVPYPWEDEQASIEDPDQSTQPDDYELDAVRELVGRSQTFVQYVNSLRKG